MGMSNEELLRKALRDAKKCGDCTLLSMHQDTPMLCYDCHRQERFEQQKNQVYVNGRKM